MTVVLNVKGVVANRIAFGILKYVSFIPPWIGGTGGPVV